MSYIDRLLAETFRHVVRTRDDLHEYQEAAVAFLHERSASMLFIGVGLGKTVIALTFLSDLEEVDGFKKALIIAPKLVAEETWPDEIPLWSHTCGFSFSVLRPKGNEPEIDQAIADAWTDTDYERVRGNAKQKIIGKYIREAEETIRHRLRRDKSRIHIVSREQIPWLVDAWGSRWPYDVVIFDEASGLKDHTTVRFDKLKSVRRYMKYFIEMTADPASESYMGLFAQTWLVDKGERFGNFITHFRKIYFDYDHYGRSYKVKDEMRDVMIDRIADVALVMRAKDYLPREEYKLIVRGVTLQPKEMMQYKRFEKEFILDLEDGTEIEAETAAALSGKLLQLCSGAVYDQDKQTHFVHDHKVEELKEIVEELQGQPLLVAYWYKSSLARLRKLFPHAPVFGKTKDAKATWNLKKSPVALIHPASAGYGLNLQHGGHDIAFFDIPWSLEKFSQTIGRLDRQGQLAEYCRVYLIATRGTRDFDVTSRLKLKQDAQEYLFNRIRKIRAKLLAEKRARELEYGGL